MKKKIYYFLVIFAVMLFAFLFLNTESQAASDVGDAKMVFHYENVDEYELDYVNHERYERPITIYEVLPDGTSTKIITYNLKYGDNIDMIEKYPDLFHAGNRYWIVIFNNDNTTECTSLVGKQNGNDINFVGNSNEFYKYIYTQCTITLEKDDIVDFSIKSKILGQIWNFAVDYIEDDENGISHAPECHYFTPLNGYYYKQVGEHDGNLVYVLAGFAEDAPNEESKYIKVNNNKYTSVIRPWMLPKGSGDYTYYARKGHDLGFLYTYDTNSITTDYRPEAGMVRRNFHYLYSNKYGVKTFKKEDVEGNPANAKFEIKFQHHYDSEIITENMKYVFKQYDSKEIKGKTYKNVYEVVGYVNEDEVNDDCIIDTQDGEFTLYYPLCYISKVRRSKDAKEFYKINSSNVGLTKKIFISEIEADDGYIINTDEIEVQTNDRVIANKDCDHEVSSAYIEINDAFWGRTADNLDEYGYDGACDWKTIHRLWFWE